MYELIDKLPPWAIIVGFSAVLALASQLGRRLGIRRSAEGADGDAESSHTGAIVGAILALLGLLLAFSFGGVDARFADRKKLVLEEANAIGTTFLRAGLLDAEQRNAVRSALSEYIDLRVAPMVTPAEVEAALRRSEELHRTLWRRGEEAAERHPDSEMVALFVSSLNDLIDLEEKRVTVGMYQRLPPITLAILGVVAVLSLGVLGYVGGVARTRSRFPSGAIILAVSFVIMLIMELDRPFGRLYHVGNEAMIDTKTMIDAYRATPHPPP